MTGRLSLARLRLLVGIEPITISAATDSVRFSSFSDVRTKCHCVFWNEVYCHGRGRHDMHPSRDTVQISKSYQTLRSKNYSRSLHCKYPTRCTLEYSFVWTVAITASGPDNSDATTLHIVCLPRPWPNPASQTNRTLYSFPQLHQMLTDFQNSFTVGLSSDSLKIPTHLTRRYTTLRNRSEVTDLVSTLSCTLLSIVSLKTGLLVSSDI